jgi:hypothetical protein
VQTAQGAGPDGRAVLCRVNAYDDERLNGYFRKKGLHALTAPQEVFTPLPTDFLALQGMSKLIDAVNVVKKRPIPT